MNYKIGYKIKPKRVADGGVVIFTDGTNEIPVSQKTCQAYGYKWDKSSSTCVIKNRSVSVSKALHNISNTIGGKKNKTGGKVSNSVIYGTGNYLEGGNKNLIVNGNNNRIKGNVRNSAIISGDNNIMSEDVNNASIISGVGAISIRDNETIVGGFRNDGSSIHGSSPAFTTQVSTFVMQTILEDTSTLQPLSLNGLDYIPTHKNSRIYLDITYMLIGDDSKTSISGRRKQETWWIDNSGAASFVATDPTAIIVIDSPDISGVPAFVQANADDELSIVALGTVNDKQIIIANVIMTEVIFESDPTI
tara:strand:+ start:1411 stop:2325 length:915 start_codon:yes stop_codon:yes gene_type:complete